MFDWFDVFIPSLATLFVFALGGLACMLVSFLFTWLFQKDVQLQAMTPSEKREQICWWRVQQVVVWSLFTSFQSLYAYCLFLFAYKDKWPIMDKWINTLWISLL